MDTDPVKIDIKWTVTKRVPEPDPRNRDVRVRLHMVPDYEDQELQDHFRIPTGFPEEYWDELSELGHRLLDEVNEHVPPAGSKGGFDLTSRLISVTHLPTGQYWMDDDLPPDRLRYTVYRYIGDEKHDEKTYTLPIDELGDFAQKAVRIIDSRATAESYRRQKQKHDELGDASPEDLPPPRSVNVFVAYRTPAKEAAKELHDIVQTHAGALFDPFIDEHNMQTGDWKDQLMRRIRGADLFMPLVTSDYAEADSVSKCELERAREVADERGIDGFVAPIIIEAPDSQDGEFLREQHACTIETQEAINEDNEDLATYLSQVGWSALRRRIDPTDE